MKNPCENCGKRYVGCHGKCDDHMSWKDNIRKVRDEADVYTMINKMKVHDKLARGGKKR